ncbi:MAG: ATP-binding protein, partial [Victivallaceae bacterium]|nr:ATP-binding protein [Victivallaceae bacterium]
GAIGMPGTGKTFRIYQKIKELEKAGSPRDRMLYLNFDDDRLAGMTMKELGLIPEIFYQLYPDNRNRLCYFFLDEIQEVDDWEVFVRRMIDSGQVQVYLTGSSSKLLSAEIATSMRGRSVETEVFPLSLVEFMKFHSIMDEVPQVFGPNARSKIRNALDRYFQIGGFPEVQDGSPESWVSKLRGYANEVLFHDVVERYGISNLPTLRYVMARAFHNPCSKLSANSIYGELKSRGIKADREGVSTYIDCFCRAYLLFQVPFHSDSLSRKRVNPPKIYATDVGMVRAMNSKQSADNGRLLENLVFLHLRRKGYEVEYLVTDDGYEVDFVAYGKLDREYHLFQVSYEMVSCGTFEREVRALRSASGTIGHPTEMTIVTWNEERDLGNGIRIVPAWKFLVDRY